MERKAKSLFADSIAAFEGLEVYLTPGLSPERIGESALSHRERGAKAVQYVQDG
jgi:hypothetical protein